MISSTGFCSPIEAVFAAELLELRPELVGPYTAELPAARAAVLAQLLRGLWMDPLPGVVERSAGSITLAGGRRLRSTGLAITLDGRSYEHPAELVGALRWPGAATLEAELAHSVAGLALARAAAPATTTAFADRTLEEHEQSVVDGHPLHPCCRNRTGFRVADHLAYGPEHRPVVALDLIAVPADRCLIRGAWPGALRDGGKLLLPVHPWQSERVLSRHGLEPQRRGGLPSRPLMALRTLAPIDRPWHVKTSLSTQLTSAVRDISADSVRSSTAVSAFVAAVVDRLSGGMRTQPTRAAAAVLVDGAPHPDLAAVLRDRPETDLRPGEIVVPVAALTARPPQGGCPPLCTLAADAPDAWVAEFSAVALPPLLTLLAWGVALEAHGQNLMLVLAGGRPRRLVYRDLADIRLCRARLESAGLPWPAPPDRMRATESELRAMLFATFIATTMTTMIATLAEHASERRLWDTVGSHIRRVYAALPETPATAADQRALLYEPIPVKPLTLMRLDPGTSAWAYQANPWSG